MKKAFIPVSIVLAILAALGVLGIFNVQVLEIVRFIVQGGFGDRLVNSFFFSNLFMNFVYMTLPLGLIIVSLLMIKNKSLSIANVAFSFVLSLLFFATLVTLRNNPMNLVFVVPVWYRIVALILHLLRYLISLLSLVVSIISLALFITSSVKEKKAQQQLEKREENVDTDEVTSEMIEETIKEQR